MAIIGHLFLFASWNYLFLRKSSWAEAWDFFRVSSVSGMILVLTMTVLARGTAAEKVAAFGLSILPAFFLILAFTVYIAEFL